jgi:hypothetical protein
MTTPTRVEICCDTACENYNKPQQFELTTKEISDLAKIAADSEARREAMEVEMAAKAEAKASAIAKLTALGLSEEETKAITG